MDLRPLPKGIYSIKDKSDRKLKDSLTLKVMSYIERHNFRFYLMIFVPEEIDQIYTHGRKQEIGHAPI
ncbi:hypothetical protein LNTAR_16403 [Lentisphaera araneosa HTCC2155]|uniref:Uncharacterized protein n=1 Tax=Lentisphaera araneosa HTCC2155 TaxID=313628 RepID=A6DQ95_9BACT|nr:hypothetical protein LNTAR_16403 [Lentisphaera araneosa HTCC2155]